MEILPYNLLILLLPLLLVLLYFLFTFKTRKTDDQNKPNIPPGPAKLPIIGNLHQLGKPLHQVLHELSKVYGPVMLLQLGRVPTLVISSAEAAQQVLKTLDHDFSTRPPLAGPKRLSYNFLDIAFVPYGEYWREVRKISVHELLSAKRVQSFKLVRAEEIDVLIYSVSSSSNTNPIDVFEMFTSFTHNAICRVAFGSTTSQSKNQFNGSLTKFLDEALSVLGGFYATDFFPKLGWIIDRITGVHGRIEKVFHGLDKLFQQMIEEHLNPVRPKPEHEDLIDVLLKLENDQTSSVRLADDNIKAILMNIFIAGVDTPAVTANWAMTELAKNPDAMKKVQEEIRT
ncbi:2-methylbutanal oxime monooxygenase-like [Papaver somniferum]|uniref:2-methylbutanal oxime monooxygenase-like n=1 Tax=Papaver somniferum TaxID=3469 RepID=UPI000E6FF31C|nr:2-methylbutanal oxime monooxygenase-like [Papaver somniferum]